MTREEYKLWYRKFSGTMPSVHKWFVNFDADMQTELSERWYRTLINVELEHAKTAIDDMFDGVIKQPDRWEYAVRAIARHAKKLAFDSRKQSHMVDGQKTVACNKCKDEGHVTCWSIRAMDSAGKATEKGGDWDGSQHGTASQMACVCPVGNRFYNWGMGRFDADTHVRYLPGLTRKENIEALLTRLRSVAEGVEWTPPELETSNHEDPW